jgi:hypothetical protein
MLFCPIESFFDKSAYGGGPRFYALLPTEMLDGIELWAAAHSNPRSRAIRLLVYRGLAHVGIPQTEGVRETIG